MSSKDVIEDDFEGEFDPIKRLSAEELENDKLVKRIQLQRKLERLERSEHVNKAELKDSENENEQDSSDKISNSSRPALRTYESKRAVKRQSHKQNIETKITTKVSKKRKHNEARIVKNAKKFEKIKSIKLYNSLEDQNPYDIANDNWSGLGEQSDQELEDQPQLKKKSQSQKCDDLNKKEAIYQESSQKSFDNAFEKLSKDDVQLANAHGQMKAPSNQQVENVIEDEIEPAIFNEFQEFVPEAKDVQTIKKQVLSQITGNSRFPNLLQSPTLLEKYNEVYRMFEHTIRDNEGHSTLIIGPRASGKTAIVENALDDLRQKYDGQFITVRLNAYIHSDDNIALREIARQLDYNAKKLKSKEDKIQPKVYNDEPRSEEESNHEASKKNGNFEQRSISDTFSNILSILDKNVNHDENNKQQTEQTSISIIFIIDEFEKFTSNNKQTLLYNLFDLSQNSATPICVVGISTRVTTRELLEKRVRSRFSQRIISINKSHTIDEFWSNAKLGLILSIDSINKLIDKKYGELWNKYIELLYTEKFNDKPSNLKKLVFQNFYTLKNFKEFNNSCVFAISNIKLSNLFPKNTDFKKYLTNQSINNIQSIIKSLSSLELLLVIAAARWIEKFDLQVINFNLAYKEYEDMIKNFNLNSTILNSSSIVDNNILTNIKVNQKVWSPKIVKNSWEILYKLGILLDSSGVTTNNDGHIISNVNLNKNLIIEDNKMVQLDVTLDELGHLIEDSNVFKRLTKL